MFFFLQILSLLYIRRVHEKNPGCTVLGEVHPVDAQNKTLISDTDKIIKNLKYNIYHKHS